MPFWRPESHADRRPFLTARGAIRDAARDWFRVQGFTEVECGALQVSPGNEAHLHAFRTDWVSENGQGRPLYLHTSPEFAAKKLLAAGETKIFDYAHVYRNRESGPLHSAEFTMLEWYRAGAPYRRVMNDCVEIARVAARETQALLRWKGRTCDPFKHAEIVTVREAFARYSNVPGGKPDGLSNDDFSAAIIQIEQPLGMPGLTLLTEYPISEAALAQRCLHDPSVAERFELYACGGVELANGFGELTDPIEQRARLVEAMEEKQKRYGQRWPIDEDFLAALAHMPPASGCALGFDRLVMLATGARHINDVLWTPS